MSGKLKLFLVWDDTMDTEWPSLFEAHDAHEAADLFLEFGEPDDEVYVREVVTKGEVGRLHGASVEVSKFSVVRKAVAVVKT